MGTYVAESPGPSEVHEGHRGTNTRRDERSVDTKDRKARIEGEEQCTNTENKEIGLEEGENNKSVLEASQFLYDSCKFVKDWFSKGLVSGDNRG